MRNTKSYAAVLVLIIITMTFGFSPVISSLTGSVVINSTGKIQTHNYAASGSAKDIQAAVDWVASRGGTGNVYIPAGTFNFVEVGESWKTVTIPAGINLFGAPTKRDANGQVVEWKTVLVMPYDVPSNDSVGIPKWFRIIGNSEPDKPSRFSDIKLVGYRTFDNSSTSMHVGIQVGGGNTGGVINFRVDHCYFLNTAGGGVVAAGSDLQNGPDTICGVVDHCKFVNTVGIVAPYESRTVSYGVYVSRGGGFGYDYSPWETDVSKILGNYTNYSVYVEDCYFEKWRHCVVSRAGAHVVSRYNTFNASFGYGDTDIHGDSPGRALEVYNCIFTNQVNPPSQADAVWIRAGCGTYFNNIVDSSYYAMCYLTNENANPTYHPRNVYIWNNTVSAGRTVYAGAGVDLDIDYFLRAPTQAQDGFAYTPYPYPHPLTLEA